MKKNLLPYAFEQILNGFEASVAADAMLREGVWRKERLTETLSLAAKFFCAENPNVRARNCTGETLLHWAWSADFASCLIVFGADVNADDHEGRTPLLRALMRKDVEVAQTLISLGANVNASDCFCMTPLHWAAWGGDCAFVRSLILRGANPNASDCDGEIPLDWVEDKDSIVARYLSSVTATDSANEQDED